MVKDSFLMLFYGRYCGKIYLYLRKAGGDV